MPVVMKGNKQLTVEEHKVKEFLGMGYSLIDEDGNITQAGNATSLAEIKAENLTLKAELTKYKSIEAENAALKAEIEELKVASKKSSK